MIYQPELVPPTKVCLKWLQSAAVQGLKITIRQNLLIVLQLLHNYVINCYVIFHLQILTHQQTLLQVAPPSTLIIQIHEINLI